jgi:hypothetical protein
MTYYVVAGCAYDHPFDENEPYDEEDDYSKTGRPFPIRLFTDKTEYDRYIEQYDCYTGYCEDSNYACMVNSPDDLVLLSIGGSGTGFFRLDGPYKTINEIEDHLMTFPTISGNLRIIKDEEQRNGSNEDIYWREVTQMEGYKIYSYTTNDVFYGVNRVYVKDVAVRRC